MADSAFLIGGVVYLGTSHARSRRALARQPSIVDEHADICAQYSNRLIYRLRAGFTPRSSENARNEAKNEGDWG